jgi:hypothetical protein
VNRIYSKEALPTNAKEIAASRVNIIKQARSDLKGLFKKLPKSAEVVAIDYLHNFADFVDDRTKKEGQLADLEYERVKGEMFFRLKIDDTLFGGNSLRVFFWAEDAKENRPAIVWVIGFAWRKDAYKRHMIIRCRNRVKRIIASGNQR